MKSENTKAIEEIELRYITNTRSIDRHYKRLAPIFTVGSAVAFVGVVYGILREFAII